MSTTTVRMGSLWSRGMIAVLIAQFLSALADNALLFAALALLRTKAYPDWTDPLLQEFFVGAYILLAPFAGPLADSLPKGRVMLLSNGLKLAGALGMCLGLNPFVTYGLVGAGAATYSPAKYGILSELTSAAHLVQANGIIEGSTIAAILAGAIAGGILADHSVTSALIAVSGCYALAALANLFIPRLAPAHSLTVLSIGSIFRDFGEAIRAILRQADARFSVIGTSLFWGAGATLRFLLVAWVPIALGITTHRMPAYLNATVAVGIVIGAALAARFVSLERVERALPAGVLIGIGVYALAGTSHVPFAFAAMVGIGACGGFFIVPLNALLQERGRETIGAGHAIAVQNLLENSTMLLMIGFYMAALRAGAPISGIAAGFGIALSVAIAGLWVHRRSHRAPSRTPA